jgi:hypothetical protein
VFERLGAVHVTGRYGGTEEIDVHLPIKRDEPETPAGALAAIPG